jgi:hypothetical protein
MKIRNGFVSNSSSSSFVCSTEYSLAEVRAKLQFLIGAYNYLMDNEIYLFDRVMIDQNKETGKVVITELYDNALPDSLYELIEDAFDATIYEKHD